MIKNNDSPNYKKHLFVCTKCKHSDYCDNPEYASELRTLLKAECKKEFSKEDVRVNAAGCLGICDQGVHVVIYPEEKWFKKVDKSSISTIIEHIKSGS